MSLSKFCQIKWERSKDLRRQGKLEEAAGELLEALDEAPDHSLLRSSLATVYLRQGKLLEAKHLVEEILVTEAQSSQALVVRGEIAFKAGSHRLRALTAWLRLLRRLQGIAPAQFGQI